MKSIYFCLSKVGLFKASLMLLYELLTSLWDGIEDELPTDPVVCLNIMLIL